MLSLRRSGPAKRLILAAKIGVLRCAEAFFGKQRGSGHLSGNKLHYYHLDRPRPCRAVTRVGSTVTVSGWALDASSGKPLEIRARLRGINGEVVRMDRPDVADAFKQVCPVQPNTGFEIVLEQSSLFSSLIIEGRSDGATFWTPFFRSLTIRDRRVRSHSLRGPDYNQYLRFEKNLASEERSEIERHIRVMLKRPKFYIVTLGDGEVSDSTIASLREQIYESWEVVAKVEDVPSGEFDYLVFLEKDDILHPECLYAFASAVNANPALDIGYGDEDRVDEQGVRHSPFFKPSWSPDYFEAYNYIGTAACIRRSLVTEGRSAYDYLLRSTEAARLVVHIPKVLSSKRTATIDPQGDIVALRGRLRRTGRIGEVRELEAGVGCYLLDVKLREKPLVSIVIPTAGKTIDILGKPVNLIVNCVESIRRKSTYSNLEFIVVDNGDLSKATTEDLDKLGCSRITFSDRDFNVAKKLNLGAERATGEMIILLNDDIEVITPDWIERMLVHFEKPHVGVVGAKLLYPDETVQHAGVVHNHGNPDHVSRHARRVESGYFFSLKAPRNFMAVTGACMMTRASVFRLVGGYTEALAVSFNDIDYCLKVAEKGRLSVMEPSAELFHFESVSRVAKLDNRELSYYYSRWAKQTTSDPYYREDSLTVAPPTFQVNVNERMI